MKAGNTTAPSVGDLLGSLAQEASTLVRQEIHMASTEMGHKGKSAALDIGVMAVGVALAQAGLLCIVCAVVLTLGTVVPAWIPALIIGFGAMATGLTLAGRGLRSLRELDPVPRRTLGTLGAEGAEGTVAKEVGA